MWGYVPESAVLTENRIKREFRLKILYNWIMSRKSNKLILFFQDA